MCFLDITGYTRLTEERGMRPRPILRRGWLGWSGGPRWSMGDAGEVARRRGDVLLPESRQLLLAALEMAEVVGSHGLPPAHVGIHAAGRVPGR